MRHVSNLLNARVPRLTQSKIRHLCRVICTYAYIFCDSITENVIPERITEILVALLFIDVLLP